jgi:hypothetical protein
MAPGRDQKADGEDDPDRAQRCDDGQRQMPPAARSAASAPADQSARACAGSKACSIRSRQKMSKPPVTSSRDQAGGPQILRTDAQHVAEQDVIKMHRGGRWRRT